MIQANELRIGNYVYDPINKENVKLVAIEQGNRPITLGSKGTSSFSGFDCLKPIELTEDVLLKCGFVEKINSSMVKFWTKNNFTIYHEYYKHDVVDNLEWFFLSSAEFDRLRIYSLHQLQNLYFCLCNQELTINL